MQRGIEEEETGFFLWARKHHTATDCPAEMRARERGGGHGQEPKRSDLTAHEAHASVELDALRSVPSQ
eukprot:28657-Rhodomonas_salina.1